MAGSRCVAARLLYPVMVESIGRERAAPLSRWTERELQELAQVAVNASGRLAACGSPPTSMSESSSRRSTRRSELTGSTWSGETSCLRLSRGRYPAANFHLPDAVLQPARVVRRLAARAAPSRGRDPAARASRLGRPNGSGDSRHRDGRLSERPRRRARGPHRPDKRTGDRHRADSRAILRGAALRPARLRLLAPGRGRAHRRRGLQRRFARRGVHGRRAADADGPAGPGDFVTALLGRALRVDFPWAGHLRADVRLPPGVGGGPGENAPLRRRRLLGPRQRPWLRLRELVASATPATATRCSTSSSPRGFWASMVRRPRVSTKL